MSDSRGAFLSCPACTGPLAEWRARDENDGPSGGESVVFACGACRGVWLDWFGEEPTRVARRVEPAPGDGPEGRAGGSCPRDGSELVLRPYLDSGPVVERCPTCLGLFASRAQLAPLAAFHERIPFDAPEPIIWVSWMTRFWHAFVK